MPARRSDPVRLLAAVNDQRAALGIAPWAGAQTVSALGSASVAAVLAALDAKAVPRPDALRAAVVYLLDLLESRAPGRSVEVRIPPYAAIQCVPGTRHTRGTPPNVVETDAVTWIMLATGRLTWAQAGRGALRASGTRANLSEYLPLAAGGPDAG
jgi:hypothetical protein